MTSPNVMPAPLKDFCCAILQKAGATPAHAEIIAETLVAANLSGIDTHGVLRLKIYATRIEKKVVNTNPDAIHILKESPTTCLIDGADSPGQIIGVMAMKKAIALAKKSGIGIVAVRNSNNFGAAGYYAVKPLACDMIGMVCCESGPNLAPFGAAEAGLGNNPIAIAIPAGTYPPLVLDMAMSVVAAGKIRKASKEGKSIPEGWVIDSDGLPTTDPLVYTERRGYLVPVGAHKGSGLAIMVSLLAGALTGPIFGKNVGRAFSLENPGHVGHLFAALRIDNFCDPAEYRQRVDERIRSLKSCRPAKGVQEILFPGEKEARTRKERLEKGIPLSANLLKELKELGTTWEVKFPPSA